MAAAAATAKYYLQFFVVSIRRIAMTFRDLLCHVQRQVVMVAEGHRQAPGVLRGNVQHRTDVGGAGLGEELVVVQQNILRCRTAILFGAEVN